MLLLHEESSSLKREKMQVATRRVSLLKNFLVRSESAKEMQVVCSPCEPADETLTVIHLSG
jgi:hypothetical protein